MTDLHEWELVAGNEDQQEYFERCRVPGGWLYRTEKTFENLVALALTFVPDSRRESTDRLAALSLLRPAPPTGSTGE
jgi:hypothetical protein